MIVARGGKLKPKDLVGQPWRLAFAMQEDGWWLRSDIIWSKPNPMPESVTDRPTRAHEYVFLLTKSARYWWDAIAAREPVTGGAHGRGNGVNPKASSIDPGDHRGRPKQNASFSAVFAGLVDHRNIRTVWEIPTQPFPDAHFATFPEEIPRRCIRAGCPKGGLVLDPFAGSGTTGYVAVSLGRRFLGIELKSEYAEMARRRIGRAREQLEMNLA